MKKKLINEVNKMRRLMELPLITEQSADDQACINQLTDGTGDEYMVVPKGECLSKMSCVDKSIKDAGFESINVIKKWGDGRCLSLTNFEDRRYLALWETGELSFIYVWDTPETLPNGDKIKKFMFEGEWECNGGVTTYKNLEFKALVDDSGDTLSPTNFDSSGGWDIEGYFNRKSVPVSGDLKILLEKTFK